MPDITSRHHPVVHAFKSAARGEGELALLDGWHLLHEAARADIELSIVAVSANPSDEERALLDRLSNTCDIVRVTPAVMDAMSPVRTPAGIVALARKKKKPMRSLWKASPALVVAAVGVQDPGNAGAIVRASEAGGATGVLFAGASADPWGWKALRASMGSTFRLPVARHDDIADACDEMRRAGLIIAATVARDGTPMHDSDLRPSVALLLGSEGPGLEQSTRAAADLRVSIPMQPPVESLNVAVAAAILVYEARRQRLASRPSRP